MKSTEENLDVNLAMKRHFVIFFRFFWGDWLDGPEKHLFQTQTIKFVFCVCSCYIYFVTYKLIFKAWNVFCFSDLYCLEN